MLCTSCGSDNRPGRKFCGECGGVLQRGCPACGTANETGTRFCGECGAALDAATSPAAQRTADATPTPAPAAERRLVSVLFADLVGFTSLAEDRDPETVRELLNRYFNAATVTVERHGGTLEKFIGDAVMAVWGTPTAHEDDAERAVRAALELVDAVRGIGPTLEARVGVLTGEAAVSIGAVDQGMVAGDLVNTAARLQGVADPGTVLVGESTMRAAANSIAFDEVGDQTLKGKTTPVPAWRALRVVAARGGQGRTDGLDPPFVGRDEELRQLKELLHTTGRDQRVRLVSVTGAAGIGKSRLVWELEKYVDGVAEDIYWHRGRSPSYGEGITFWALGEMVRRRARLAEDDDEMTTRERISASVAEFVPQESERAEIASALLALLGVEPAPPGGRDALFPAWRTFFERIAARGSTVLIFEDVHWADSGLLDFIDHLLDWSHGLPIMVVTLARPQLFDRRPHWGAGRRIFTAMALEPLGDNDIRALLEGLVPGLPTDAVGAIVGRAEGIPLYAVETVRALLADRRIERHGEAYRPVGDVFTLSVPESLRALIASRLDALEPADRSLLQDASVVGQVFAVSTLSVVTGQPEADLGPPLRGLVRRELLELETDPVSPERGQYKFVQSLIREVAYGTLARRDRRARHLAVARHYEVVGDDELAGALAGHYVAAHEASEEGPEADAVAAQARLALGAAAERAASLGAHEQAVRHLEQAIALSRDLSEQAELLERAAVSADALASGSAEDYARRAVAAREASGDVLGVFRATALLARVLTDMSRIAEAIKVVEDVLARPDRPDDEAMEAELYAELSRGYMRHHEPEPAVTAAERALGSAERLNLERVVAEALNNRASALSLLGRRREAAALMEAAVQLSVAGGWTDLELRFRNNLASALQDDDPARAAEIARTAAELARHVGHHGMFLWLAGTAASFMFGGGRDWDAAEALVTEAIGMAGPAVQEGRFEIGRLVSITAGYATARGEDAVERVEEVQRLGSALSDPIVPAVLEFHTADLALVRGSYAEAARLALRAGQLHEAVRDAAVDIGRLAVALSGSSELAPAVVAMTEQLPGTGLTGRARLAAARSVHLALSGQHGDALLQHRDALRLWRQTEQHFELARTILAGLCLFSGDAEVQAHVDDAHNVFAACRARPYLEMLHQVKVRTALGAADAPRAADPSPSPAS